MSNDVQNMILKTVERIENKLDGQDTRLRKVENWQSNVSGKTTVIHAVVNGFWGLAGGVLAVFLGSRH